MWRHLKKLRTFIFSINSQPCQCITSKQIIKNQAYFPLTGKFPKASEKRENYWFLDTTPIPGIFSQNKKKKKQNAGAFFLIWMFLKTSKKRKDYKFLDSTPNPDIFRKGQLHLFLSPKFFLEPIGKTEKGEAKRQSKMK